MTEEEFFAIFDKDILPIIQEVEDNNSLIRRNDLKACKEKIYEEYTALNQRYKKHIFEPDEERVLLDRHKVAACICGAFLKVPVFNKQSLIDQIIRERQKVEVFFYYVNEYVAFRAAAKFLSFFMVNDRRGEKEVITAILRDFPKMPSVTKNRTGFWNSVLFNLSQIKDAGQIGVEHYDMYSYAMFFFWLESYFNEKLAA